MPLFEIRVPIPLERVEAADEVLLVREDVRWSVYEDVLARTAWVVGMFASEAEAREAWAALADEVETSGELVIHPVSDADWRESYKVHFKPWQIGRLHWVPVWERGTYNLPRGAEVVWLDPGMAFGTGNHETTRLCVERLVELASEMPEVARSSSVARARPMGRGAFSVIDAGCGSGILAISAVKLGFGRVCGFDNDAEAVAIAKENAALNEVVGQVLFFEGDLVTGFAAGTADVVVANILANVLIAFAPQLVAAVKPGGALVLSGILACEIDDVRSAYVKTAPGWTSDSRVIGEWADLCLRRDSMAKSPNGR